MRRLVPADACRRAAPRAPAAAARRAARRQRGTGSAAALGADFDRVVAARRAEADEFYAELTPQRASADEARSCGRRFAGMLWSKQLYHYDVTRWLDGDPAQPAPPPAAASGRNSALAQLRRVRHHVDAGQVGVPLVRRLGSGRSTAWRWRTSIPAFAKYQLILLCREWFQHPNGALPAYEWDFGDVNPPVQAWAALEVFAIDGGRDLDFLSRIFDKLLVNFTWWVNREDAEGNNLFEGGFLGLDNIGPIDRSHLPVGGVLEQSDATGWMAFYALAMAAHRRRAAPQRPTARAATW